MEEMTDKEPGSGDESVKIDSINGCITTSLILFRTSSLLPKASIDLESLTCAKNKFYSSFLLLLLRFIGSCWLVNELHLSQVNIYGVSGYK